MTKRTEDMTAIECFEAMFGVPYDSLKPESVLRGVRLKISPTGHLTLAHPQADGANIIRVQQVPDTVSTADVLRRMDAVTVLRRNKTLHYNEIKPGVILR